MRSTGFLFLAAAACLPAVLAKCYKYGIKGNFRTTDNPVVDLVTVCGQLKGLFTQGETKKMCVSDKEGKRWDFTLKYIGSDGHREIGSTECFDGMQKQAICEYGGRRSYWNWYYRADPNEGACLGGPMT